MTVDSFKFLPRLIARFYRLQQRSPVLPIPWTPLNKPVSKSCFVLLTSGGLYHRSYQSPFDIEREKNQPTWGDPSYRIIPRDIPQADLGVSHLHYNSHAVLRDINVLLPVKHFSRLALEGRIGSLSKETYSVMGYQGYPPDTRSWESQIGVEIAKRMINNGVNCVMLVPAWPDCVLNVPVLARLFESWGMSTIFITPMPYWAEKIGVPRTLAVEFPFGQTLGQAFDEATHYRVISQALEVLEEAEKPGVIIHSPEIWPIPTKQAIADWQPPEPSPIVQHLAPHFRALVRQNNGPK